MQVKKKGPRFNTFSVLLMILLFCFHLICYYCVSYLIAMDKYTFKDYENKQLAEYQSIVDTIWMEGISKIDYEDIDLNLSSIKIDIDKACNEGLMLSNYEYISSSIYLKDLTIIQDGKHFTFMPKSMLEFEYFPKIDAEKRTISFTKNYNVMKNNYLHKKAYEIFLFLCLPPTFIQFILYYYLVLYKPKRQKAISE